MKNTAIVLLLLASVLFVRVSTQAKAWRGIIPLHSTRSDVERLLGQGATWCNCSYDLDDMSILVNYSSGDCHTGGSGGWNVPPDTVLKVTIVPKPNPSFSDFKIDERRFKKEQSGDVEGVWQYTNEEEGFSLVVIDGKVRTIYYEPSAKDKNLRCH